MARQIDFTDALTSPPAPFLTDDPPSDEVLSNLLTASDVALQHSEATVHQLAAATQRRVQEIQQNIRRRLARDKAEITAQQIALLVERVACPLRTNTAALRGDSRRLHVAFQRQVTVYLYRRISGASYLTIAMAVNHDHSTCIHSFQTIACRVTGDPAFREFIDQLETQITNTMAGNTGAAAEAAA